MRDLLLDDRELIPEMFRNAEMDVARDSMRRLMLTPVFDDLTKRSLLARIIKLYPELEAMITGAQTEEKDGSARCFLEQPASGAKAEYEELIKKKIPENTKEISLARSYGDLSENFEFKAAKQMQAVLMRRKTELEQMLHRARGTAFENPDTSRVSIGTIVTLRDADSETEETYTILGAWDGDPERAYYLLSNGDRAGAARPHVAIRRNRSRLNVRPCGSRTFEPAPLMCRSKPRRSDRRARAIRNRRRVSVLVEEVAVGIAL